MLYQDTTAAFSNPDRGECTFGVFIYAISCRILLNEALQIKTKKTAANTELFLSPLRIAWAVLILRYSTKGITLRKEAC
jgi:hypothetical protein